MRDGHKDNILAFLADNPLKEYESHVIAREVKCHTSTANDLLRELAEEKKAKSRKDGYCLYWRYDVASFMSRRLLYRAWKMGLLDDTSLNTSNTD